MCSVLSQELTVGDDYKILCVSPYACVCTHKDETLSAVYVKTSKLVVSLRFYTAEYSSLFW